MNNLGTLSSIPELDAEEELDKKWVPKKKHEVLKAKYKCLKKLFQVYDASVIGILPEPILENSDGPKANRRRKRSHRTKTDAGSGTNEMSKDTSEDSYLDTTAVVRALAIDQRDQSCDSIVSDEKTSKYVEAVANDFMESSCIGCNCEACSCCNLKENSINIKCNRSCSVQERRKLTRFQCFVQRLFGIRRECYNSFNLEMRAHSDPALTFREKRRRRGLRFRRIRRVKIKADPKDVHSPSILSYVQEVQRNCLLDTTARQCPIFGCHMILNGIINYNDHLNLSHFKDRKYVCHYCHKGFEFESDKIAHENEHIGIGKFANNMCKVDAKTASDTQTDLETRIPEDKLKKIVSFFDKISDANQLIVDAKNDKSLDIFTSKVKRAGSDKSVSTRAYSCCSIQKQENKMAALPETAALRRTTTLSCHVCGEKFNFSRQLSQHVYLEHRIHEKCTKHHSCAGIMNTPRPAMVSEDGSIKVESAELSRSKSLMHKGSLSATPTECSLLWDQSEESLTCDPSTNIVYCNSLESLQKSSIVDALAKKVRSYRWEPGTKIIRV